MSSLGSCPWDALLPEIVARIAFCLPRNEVACTVRLINKSTAILFQGCVSVWLSQPVPHDAFVRRWGDERSVHDFTLERRQQLICLTARSGVVANLEVAVTAVGCSLWSEVFTAAAEGGHVVVCDWLLDRGCPRQPEMAIRCAVRGGHTAVVRWLLERSPELAGEALMAAAGADQRALCEELLAAAVAEPKSIKSAAYKAAEGGHVELTEWLLGQLAEPSDVWDGLLLTWAAYGFELPALQRLYHSRLGSEAPAEFREADRPDLAAAALASFTPDWRAKLEWLEAAGCRLGQFQLWDDITKREDAVARVALLRERGLLDARECLKAAVANASLPVVQYLRSVGLPTGALDDEVIMETATEVGDVAILAELLAAGGRIGPREVRIAVQHGHLHVLNWMEEPEAGPVAAAALQEALQDAELAECGAGNGSLELIEWLWERGCPSDEVVFTAAAAAGDAVILERLAARGYPMSCEAYVRAGQNGDLATLRCLRRLDCPWGPDCDTFDRAVNDYGNCCSLEVLRWLVAEGCPVDWQSARAQAWRGGGRGADADVLAWIESHIPQA